VPLLQSEIAYGIINTERKSVKPQHLGLNFHPQPQNMFTDLLLSLKYVISVLT